MRTGHSTRRLAIAGVAGVSLLLAGCGAGDTQGVKDAILEGAGLSSFSAACTQGITWICAISDVDASSSSVVKVTIQTTANDKDFGEKVARGVFNFTNSKFPDIEWVQVNNANGNVLANTRFG